MVRREGLGVQYEEGVEGYWDVDYLAGLSLLVDTFRIW